MYRYDVLYFGQEGSSFDVSRTGLFSLHERFNRIVGSPRGSRVSRKKSPNGIPRSQLPEQHVIPFPNSENPIGNARSAPGNISQLTGASPSA